MFALYALVLWLLFLVTRRRLRRRLGVRRERRGLPERVGRWWPALLLLVPVIVGGAAIPVIAGLVLVSSGFEYVGFVLSSAVSLVVAVSLAGALLLAGRAFSAAEKRAVALGDAAVLTSLFWVCLAFLALYQVLWVVFVLALTSVWPLKVVTPK